MMVDDVVAQIVARLKEQGLYENTVVVFAADNGCFHGAGVKEMEAGGHFPSYIYRGYKSDLFDGGHRVPLVVSRGGKNGGRVERGLVSLTDFYATFAEMAGYRLTPGEGEDSYSLWGVVTGKGGNLRPDAVHHSNNGSFSLREGRWKILFTAGSGGWSFPTFPKDRGVYRHASFDAALRPGERPRRDEKRDRRTPRRRAPSDRPDAGSISNADARRPDPFRRNETRGEWKQTALFMNEAE